MPQPRPSKLRYLSQECSIIPAWLMGGKDESLTATPSRKLQCTDQAQDWYVLGVWELPSSPPPHPRQPGKALQLSESLATIWLGLKDHTKDFGLGLNYSIPIVYFSCPLIVSVKHLKNISHTRTTHKQPSLIIIGIDSL